MFAISSDTAKGLVITTYTGSVAIDERCETLEETITQVHALGATKLLIDFTGAHLLIQSIKATRRLADHILHYHHILRMMKIAYVMPDHKFDAALEVMARGRGLIAERFGSTDEALAWLFDDVIRPAPSPSRNHLDVRHLHQNKPTGQADRREF